MQGMTTALMLAVLALAVTVEQAASAEESFVPSVLYVSFQLNDTQPYDSSNDSVIIDKSDDTPLVELRLPNLFPFFGEFIDRVFVSPNGYVQTSPVNLCRCCFCFPCGADYYGMIAGILQDLNTFGSDSAYVSVHQSQSNVTTIYYNKVYYFGYEHYQMDFGIRLFPDGGINIMYDNITQYDKLFSGQRNCSWLTGLIAPNIAHSNKTFTVTSEQKDVQNNVWAAKNLGVYPYSRGDVISNSRLILCPVSTVWGITPAIIDNQTSIVNITTLSMSCVGEHHDRNHSIQIALSFASNYSSGRHALQDFMECDPMDVVADIKPSPVTFTCNFSSFDMSLFADHEELLFYVVWRPATLADSATDYQFFGAPDEFLPLRVNFSNTVDPTSCAVTKPVGSCTPCEIVRSGYESASVLDCLNLDCTHDQSLSTLDTFHSTASFSTFSDVSYYQTLYMRPSCYNESCESTFAYDIDYMGECCLISDMDCMGKCDGTSVAGMNLRQGWMNCCSPGEAIDCLGYCNGPATHDCLGVCAGSAVFDCHDVCNGTAVIDACGVCGGRDAYFCPKVNLSVDTGPNPFNSAHHLLTVYDASNRLHVAVNYITVTNENDVMLNISFEIPVIPTLPPFLSLPQGVYHISPMSNVSFLILSNITDLFDRYDSWAVNTFNIRSVDVHVKQTINRVNSVCIVILIT
jgi:hypothetical protein